MEGGGDGSSEAPDEGAQDAEGTGRASFRPALIVGLGYTDHDKAVKKKAQALYYKYVKVQEIAAQLNIPVATVTTWRRRGLWLQKRDGFNQALAQSIHAKKAFTYGKIASQAVEVIARVLNGLATQATPPSVAEAVQLSHIIKNLDGVMRLAQGLPTAVTKHEGTVGLEAIAMKTRAEIERVIAADPMVTLSDETNRALRQGLQHNNQRETLALEDRDGELDEELALEEET